MLKLLGILFAVAGASGVGLSMAVSLGRTVSLLRRLSESLERMKAEIAYRKTPLPQLFSILADSSGAPLSDFWGRLSTALQSSREASVAAVVQATLAELPPSAFPYQIRRLLVTLSSALGSYDTASQLQAIDSVLRQLQNMQERLAGDQQGRARSYCTLGVCAGLAIAIIVI